MPSWIEPDEIGAKEMCLGIPMKIQKIDGNAASAELGGTTRRIYLDILDQEVQVGDFVIVHAGFAIHKIDESEAQETLDLYHKAGLLSDAEIETGHGVRRSPILRKPLVPERHCGSGGVPLEDEQEGKAAPLERRRGKNSPPANPEWVTA